jgi:hypothetical protein
MDRVASSSVTDLRGIVGVGNPTGGVEALLAVLVMLHVPPTGSCRRSEAEAA